MYLLGRGIALMNRRLLWRVRRKLILSYIFIGFIPAILLLAFFMLGGVLLFDSFSAYMVQSEFRALTARADAVAETAAAEIERAGGRDITGILERREVMAAKDFPGASIAVVPSDRPCASRESAMAAAPGWAPHVIATAGPWAHVEPPADIPDWIGCDGFRGLLAASAEEGALVDRPAIGGVAGERLPLVAAPADTRVIVRAVAFPHSLTPRYAIVVDLVVNAALTQKLRDAVGVELSRVSNVSKGIALLHRLGTDADDPAPAAAQSSPPFTFIALLEYRDWKTGQAGTLQTSIRLGIGEIYDRISAAPGLDSTRNVVIILAEAVGGLFLIIESDRARRRGWRSRVRSRGRCTNCSWNRARPSRRLHAQDRASRPHDQLGELAELVQFDDRPASRICSCRPRRKSGWKRSCASRTRSRCRSCPQVPLHDAGPLDHGALRAGA